MNYSGWLLGVGVIFGACGPSNALANAHVGTEPAAPVESEAPISPPDTVAGAEEASPAAAEEAATPDGDGDADDARGGAAAEQAPEGPDQDSVEGAPEAAAEGAEEGAVEGAVEGTEEETPKSKSHFKTFGISLSPGFGYGITLAGDKFCGAFSESADDSDGRKPVCSSLTPAYLEIALSYGVTKRIDLVLGARINLQKRGYNDAKCPAGEATCTEGEGLFVDALGAGLFPGIRIWGKGTERTVKFGAGIDFMVMFENFDGYKGRPRYPGEEDPSSAEYSTNRLDEAAVGNVELGLRVGPVLAVDPHHNVGLFFFPAIHPSFRPSQAAELDGGWLQIGLDFSAGIQARFP